MKFNLNFVQGLKPFLDVVASLPPAKFDYEEEYYLEDPFGESDVVEINSLDIIEKTKGPLSIAGQMVVLYIKDHGMNVAAVLEGDVFSGRRVHLAYCKTLKSMESQGLFDRYHLSRNPKKVYRVSGTRSFWKNEVIEGDAELAICKDCLTFLNYDSYRKLKKADRTARTIDFDYDRFFSIYSSMFQKVPTKTEEDNAGYVENWRQISIDARAAKSYTCEECGFRADPSRSAYIHVHHINRDKTNNSSSNLKVLCIDCHRIQPGHGHLWTNPKLLKEFRKAKGVNLANLTQRDARNSCLDHIDPALRAPTDRLLKRFAETPVVAYEFELNGRIAFQADVAFTANRIGICLDVNDEERTIANKAGWQLLSHNEAMTL
jgi:hypothetical protein